MQPRLSEMHEPSSTVAAATKLSAAGSVQPPYVQLASAAVAVESKLSAKACAQPGTSSRQEPSSSLAAEW